jgi:hypothetical protein
MKKSIDIVMVFLTCSILFTVGIFFVMLIKAAYRFIVSLLSDSLVDWLLYGIAASILSVIVVVILNEKENE